MIPIILFVNASLLCVLLWILRFKIGKQMEALTKLLTKTSERIDKLEQSYQSLAAGQYMLLLSDVKGEIDFFENSNKTDIKEEIRSFIKKTDENYQQIIETQKKIFPDDKSPTLPWLK